MNASGRGSDRREKTTDVRAADIALIALGIVFIVAPLDAASKRLAKSQDDIGRAFTPFYGAETGSKVTTLLRQHTSLVKEMIEASMAKDTAKLKEADKRWRANADSITTVLSTVNPTNWPMATIQPVLVAGMNLTIA